jgi:hypothetical protein
MTASCNLHEWINGRNGCVNEGTEKQLRNQKNERGNVNKIPRIHDLNKAWKSHWINILMKYINKMSYRGVELGPKRDKKMRGLSRASREHTKITERKWWRPASMNQRWYTARGVNHNWRPTPPKKFNLDHRRTRYKYTQASNSYPWPWPVGLPSVPGRRCR